MEILAQIVFTTLEELEGGLTISNVGGGLVGGPSSNEVFLVLARAFLGHFWTG